MHELMHSVTRVNLRSLVRTLAPSLIVALLLCGSTMAGKIPVPGTPVPITLQTFVLMTAALTLGWRRATAGTVLYLGLGAAGLPVFSGGGSTLSLIGPSGGFLFGFVPSVMLTAVLAGTANRAITSLRTKHDMHPALAGAARFIACFMACAFGFLIAGYGFGPLPVHRHRHASGHHRRLHARLRARRPNQDRRRLTAGTAGTRLCGFRTLTRALYRVVSLPLAARPRRRCAPHALGRCRRARSARRLR